MDFAKLLNNCMNRIDGKKDENKDVNVGDHDKEVDNCPSVRSEIKDIIEEKFKQKDNLESLQDVNDFADNVTKESVKESSKGNVLFSLKDFFERSSESNEDEISDNGLSNKDSSSDDLDETVEVSGDDLDENADELYNDDHDIFKGSDARSDKCDFNFVEPNLSGLHDSKTENMLVDGHEFLPDSNLESELNKLEKLKEKLDESLINIPEKGKETLNGSLISLSEKVKELDESLTSSITTEKVNNPNEAGSASEKQENTSKDENITNVNKNVNSKEFDKAEHLEDSPVKTKIIEGTDTDPINIDDDSLKKADSKVNGDASMAFDQKKESTKLKETKSIFKNISISVVGGSSKPIDIESLFTNRQISPPPLLKPSFQSIFPNNPNISLSKTTSGDPIRMFSSKRKWQSNSVLVSSNDESPKRSVPTVTLDESTIVEVSDDDDFEDDLKENLAYQFNNCTHGDLVDYMCVDCTYNRWRCEWDFVRSRKVKRKAGELAVELVNPVEIIQAGNWEKVFQHSGIGVEEVVIK